MDRVTILQGRLVIWVLAAALALAVAVVVPRATSAAPPEPVDETPIPIEGICDFPLQAELSGKSNVKELPGGRTLSTSPGLRVTLTNLEEPTNQVTYVITGSFLLTELDDGNQFVVARGRNIVFGPDVGMFLTIGRVTFVAVDADGTPIALTRPEGNGRIIDVCAQLA
jgi:hypothetical protein